MKSLFLIILLNLIISSCGISENGDVTCTFNDKVITFRNAATTLNIGVDFTFEILYKKEGKQFNITAENKTNPSVFLHDSQNNNIEFIRKTVQINEIKDKFGSGKKVRIEGLSEDGRIRCWYTVNSYINFPDVFQVKATFINISNEKYFIQDYTLDQLSLIPPAGEPEWWSFQGASYRWGNDFAFPLPESFSRENYMGLNAVKAGGGIPLVDVWNKEYGLALAYLGDKPNDLFLPVKSENSKVNLRIKGNFINRFLNPADSLVSEQTAIIIHQKDFFDPLRTYSLLIKQLLPKFLKPVENAYQPEWCTWGSGQNFKPEQIVSNLDRLKALGIHSVILDDGWSVNHGDWIPDPKKFPGGDSDFKQLIDKIHKSGLKVWIWWVPGYADSTSSLATQHHDWLIQNKDGSVHPSFGLCPAYKPVQDHYRKLVQKFVEEYKLDGFKLDFGEINAAPPCYNPLHHHNNPDESFLSTPILFQNIYETASRYNPDILIEYCACGIPPTIFNLPWTNLAVTSDPNISQITMRIKMYKALRGDDFPVLEEYCGVLAGPVYQLTIGAGGVTGTFSTRLDNYNEKWLKIYEKYQLSKGKYLNLYDFGFDYPEAHVIKKDNKYYFAFYAHSWKQSESPKRMYRFGNEFDFNLAGKTEFIFPSERFSGKINLRGLDKKMKYKVVDYANNKELGTIMGDDPNLNVSFDDYLLLELEPLK